MSQTRDSLRSLQIDPNAEKWFHFSAFVIWGGVIAFLLLGLALRVYRLDSKGFWGDEIFQVRQALRPLPALLTRGQTPEIYDDFALHFIALHFVGELGRGEFWLRLPSVAYSLLAMAVTCLIGTRLFGRGTGMVALLLMAVAPFQIWYAQETRMYAAHTFYSALSFYFFIRLLARPERGALLGMTVANVLGLYNHLFMVLPLLVQAIVAVCFIAGGLKNRTRDRRGEWILGCLAATFLLCLPLVWGFAPFLSLQVSDATGDPANAVRKIDLPFVQDLLLYLSMGSDWSWRVILSVALALVGGTSLLRRDRRMIWIPLVFLLPLLLLYLITPAGNLAHRYLIFMQPLYLVLIAGGVWWLGSKGITLYARGDAARFLRGARVALVGGLVLLVVVIAPPLAALYPRAKLNDWRAVTAYIRAQGGADDLVRLESASWGERAFRWYYPDARAQFSTAGELEAARLERRPLWYVSFGGFFDAESDTWAIKHLTRIPDSDWQQSDLVYASDDSFKFPQSESPTIIYHSEWESE